MDFVLTEEQQMFRKLFRDFATKEVAKVAEQTDKREEFPAKLIKRAANQGFLGVFAPEEPAVRALGKRVKESFDPKGVLNPGRMWAGA